MASYSCRNCGGDDLREDFEHGDIVCYGCGCCAATIICDAPSFGDVAANPLLAGGATRSSLQAGGNTAVAGTRSAPYQRKTYFNERLSQWQRQEPAVSEDDQLVIIKCWNKWAPVTWPKDWNDKLATTKERISAVLEYIDRKRRRKQLRPYFKTKYLEKWISIRHWFTRLESTGAFVDGEDIAWIKSQFLRVERVFNQNIRGRGTSAGRRSFLNYNFVARRLLEMRGAHYAICDWPPLKTVAKQRSLITMWRLICRHLNWPYINTDAEVFPNAIS